MMRRLLTTTLALPLLFANSSFQKALRFVGGSYYVSDYKEGKGIASLLMTGNPEYMVIYADQNKCGRGGACQLSAFKDDVQFVIYRLYKVSEEGDKVLYQVELFTLAQVGRKIKDAESLENLINIQIRIKADVSWNNAISTNTTFTMGQSKNMTMNVEYQGKTRSYVLSAPSVQTRYWMLDSG